jgi:maltooligosyltrehalose trehalohydrolase
MKYGATPLAEGGVRFRVWAPKLQTLAVKICGSQDREFPMTRSGEDFEVHVPDARPGDLYSFVLDGERARPDPVSRFQPQGVHGASQIVDPDSFAWTDSSWKGIPLASHIFYELHTGAFTPEGTFEGIISKLPHLKELGITAIELMPIAQFAGNRNWGYDGVNLYAPHSAYGGPEGLKKLVDACHREGFAVVLDVVYNHFGPEGNYLTEFAPYLTDYYRSPWGCAINFDKAGSDGVRRYIIDNALYWLTEYHIDALRLDAIQGVHDFGAPHVLAEMAERFHEEADRLGRQAWIIAESDLNDVRVIKPRSVGGLQLDAQWHDEFHHALVSFLRETNRGFLAGFGSLQHVQKAIVEGFVYDGIYSADRGRRFGTSSADQPAERFVAFIQDHDQIANTCQGSRLSDLVSLEQYKAAVALLLCSPYLPLLFMGEEFADRSPFLYFTSHTEPELAHAVSEGRHKEFADFACDAEFNDPQSSETFEKSKIGWARVQQATHADVLKLYRDLIALRKRTPALANCRKDLVRVEINEEARWLKMERSDPGGTAALLICNFSGERLEVGPLEGWRLALQTSVVLSGPRADLYLR